MAAACVRPLSLPPRARPLLSLAAASAFLTNLSKASKPKGQLSKCMSSAACGQRHRATSASPICGVTRGVLSPSAASVSAALPCVHSSPKWLQLKGIPSPEK